MEIKQLNKNQTKQINTILNNWIKTEFEDYYNEIKTSFGIMKDTSFKEFKARLRDLILNGFDYKTPTIAEDYYFYREEVLNNLNQFNDFIEDETTEDLINFNEDDKRFNEVTYYDNDYYKETLNLIFNQDITKSFKISRDDAYIQISDENVCLNVLDELKYYDTFKEFLEHLEGNMLYTDIDKDDLIKAYIYHFHYKVFSWYRDIEPIEKDIKSIVKHIEISIKEELKNRKRKLTKTLKQKNEEKAVMQKIFEDTFSNKLKEITNISNEIEAIRDKQNKEKSEAKK